MRQRQIDNGIFWLGAIDWDRRLFDSLIPLPDGTSYNAYLVEGTAAIPVVDYVIAHHGEQDHSGSIPAVLARYPKAEVLTNPKCKAELIDHLHIAEDRFQTVEDGEEVALGGKTLRFIYTPWVHWPETMVTYVPENRILFTCDFFGSHLATSELYADPATVLDPAKRYYAEIMMPFRGIIQKNIEKIKGLDIEIIAPSHGPIYDQPDVIVNAYRDWIGDHVTNTVVIPYISMHGSTEKLVDRLVAGLAEKGIRAEPFDLAVTDLGKLAMSLVDAATIIIGSPIVLAGPHPNVVYAAVLANALKPKARFASVVGSYGWGGKLVEQIAGLIPNLKVELLDPVLCKGLPREDDLAAVDRLVNDIAAKHAEIGLIERTPVTA